MTEADHRQVGTFLHRAVQLALLVQKEAKSKLLKDFMRVATDKKWEGESRGLIVELREEVRAFARRWPLPGVDEATIERVKGLVGDEE